MSGPRLSIIPAGAVTDRSLEPRDLQVLCLLGRHTDRLGWCVRSQVKMAVELDCGRSSVQRSLDRLVDAGWVEKRRRGQVPVDDPGQPSASFAYRVVLDRDDPALNLGLAEPSESHAENASREANCPPVGSRETPADGHPGAQGSDENDISEPQKGPENKDLATLGTGAHVAAVEETGDFPKKLGTNNDPLERPHLERERDARARDRNARFLVNFEARWPTAAADDRQRTAYAAEALTEVEQDAALKGIAPFLENLKRLKRTTVPAGWKYLEERRWTLLDQKPDGVAQTAQFEGGSAEAKAIAVLFAVADKSSFFYSVLRGSDGVVRYRKEVTPQLLALAQAPPHGDWVKLDHRQAGAWEDLLGAYVTVASRSRLAEGSRAPWPWPPGKDGKIYSTGPPETLLTAQDVADLDQLKA